MVIWKCDALGRRISVPCGDYMFQNNKPFISTKLKACLLALGVAWVAGSLLLLQAEANRMGLDRLYEVSRIDR